jgi:hypothetical protein
MMQAITAKICERPGVADKEEIRRRLIAIVDSIGPDLEAGEAESEALGYLAPKSVELIRNSGLLNMKLCPELGGEDADGDIQVDVHLYRLYGNDLFPLKRCRAAQIFRQG